jgi:hypothetical protein
MSSDQFIPERDFLSKRTSSRTRISGRAWVKRDFEFWHRCTVEHDDGAVVTVSLDNMDELKVERDHVQSFELEPGDLIFVQHWDGAISGYPAFIIAVNGEAAEVEFPGSLYGKTERGMWLLRDIRIYGDLALTDWKKGTRVFAYKTIRFDPPLFLLFPATLRGVHFDVCVEVEFGDGETAFVPATLVEKPDISAGDMVYTCTSFVTHGTNPDERWNPCRILQRAGDKLLLQDGAGEQFESQISMIAVLPKGYQMIDSKFVRIPNDSADMSPRSALELSISGDAYIVRTDHWLNAADDPVTKAQVDALIAADPELAWSADIWDKMSDDERIVTRSFSILWKRQPCFWWYRNGIRCTAPNEEQLAKMIEMAVELDANVIGYDGMEYH